MATKGSLVLTYADWAKRLDPNGAIDAIVEILNDSNPILEDAMVMEGNLPTGHRTTVRDGLPSVAWRQLNYGVPTSKGKTRQVTDTCGMLETYAEVDKSLADLNGNTSAFRLSEDKAFLEAMNQEMVSTLFYGSTKTDPEKFMGLAPRYNVISTDPLNSGSNIIDAGGSGADNASIWLMTWGDETAHMTFPKGQTAGLQQSDLGEQTLEDAAGGKYQGYRTHYKWDAGFVLRDWRYVVRIANIDVSDLATFGAATDNSAALIRLMIQAVNKRPTGTTKASVFYVSKTVKTWLDIMAMEKANVNLSIDMVEGKPITRFLGHPVRVCDGLLETEAAVS